MATRVTQQVVQVGKRTTSPSARVTSVAVEVLQSVDGAGGGGGGGGSTTAIMYIIASG